MRKHKQWTAKRFSALSNFPSFRAWIVVLVTALLGTPLAAAKRCEVPGLHPTIQRAVDDSACGEIALGSGVYAESVSIGRSLTLRGDALGETRIEGRFVIDGVGTLVSFADLVVESSCDSPIETRSGSQFALAAVEISPSSSIPCGAVGGTEAMVAQVEDDFLVLDSQDARDPRVGMDSHGGTYFVYTDTDTDIIHWISYDDEENLVTAAAPLATTAGTQEFPDIAVQPDGSFYAAWRSEEDVNRQIRGRYYDPVGGLDAADALVNDLPDPIIHFGMEAGGVAELGDGGFAVTWSSRQSHGEQDPDDDDVQGQRIGSSGVVAATPQFQANNLVNSGRQTEADVTPTADGGFLAVWECYFSNGYQIRGRRYASDGTPMGDEFQIETDTTGGQHDPRAAMNGRGEILVVWTSGSTPTTIRGRLFDATVTPVGDDFLISTRTDVKQQFPDVAGATKDFVVAWELQDGDWDVWGRVVTGHDTFDGLAFQANSYDPPSLRHNEVGVGAFGYQAIIAWQGTFSESSGLHSITGRSIYLCELFCDGFESQDTSFWTTTLSP